MILLLILALVLTSVDVTIGGKKGKKVKEVCPPESCKALYDQGIRCSGIYEIKPNKVPAFPVYCDMDTAGGGWTVFQRRLYGTEDFYRGWNDYVGGFGSLDGDFWLGLGKINRLTDQDAPVELRVDLYDFAGGQRHAAYSNFRVGSSATKYQLNVDGYSGDAGDSLAYHNNAPFTTLDNDNDQSGGNCAVTYTGAWWYKDCHVSNLNGAYLSGKTEVYAKGVVWYDWLGYYYSLKVTQMAVR